MTCTGLPRATLSRGEVAWLDGDLRASAGAGKYVARDPFPAVHVANATWQESTLPRRCARRCYAVNRTLCFAMGSARRAKAGIQSLDTDRRVPFPMRGKSDELSTSG